MFVPSSRNGLPRREVLAFLADIRDNPEDDAPRLILADWLQEQDDPVQVARGEFVRLQCLAPRTEPSRTRQAELLQQFADAWLGPLRKYVEAWICWRGLLHVGAAAPVLLGDAAADEVPEEGFAWIEGVTLFGMDSRLAVRLAESPWLAGITTLEMRGGRIGTTGARALANSPYVRSLRTLLLGGHNIGDGGAEALAHAPALERLATVSLTNNRITDAGARAWAASPHLPRMTGLMLGGNPITQEAIRTLEMAAVAHPRLWAHFGA